MPNTISCSLSLSNSILTISNLVQSNLINITLLQSIIKLPNSSLSFKVKSSTHYESISGTTIITDFLPYSLTYTLEQTSWLINATTNITINYTISSASVPNISSIIIEVPSEYTTAQPDNKFNITALDGSITLQNIQNPSHNYSGPFILIAFTSSN